jgi:hypothetical protein
LPHREEGGCGTANKAGVVLSRVSQRRKNKVLNEVNPASRG